MKFCWSFCLFDRPFSTLLHFRFKLDGILLHFRFSLDGDSVMKRGTDYQIHEEEEEEENKDKKTKKLKKADGYISLG